MKFDPSNIIQLIFAFQAGFFGVFAYQYKRLRSFALLLLAFAVHMAFNLLAETGNLGPLPNITSAFGFAYGPLIYLFVRDITQAIPKTSLKDLLHGIPFVIALPFSPSNLVFDIFGFLSIGIYFVRTYLYIRDYHAAIKDSQPDQFASKLDWLTAGFFAFAATAMYDAVRIFLSHRYDEFHSDFYYLITLCSTFLTINWLIFRALRFRDLFSGLTENELLAIDKNGAPNLDPLLPDEIELTTQALKTLEDRQLYLNPNFRLAHFSEATGIEERDLSKWLYQHTGNRFPMIVNQLRVDRAKTLINKAEDDACNFLMISFEAGFNSKSSFNQVFKNITGLTPSAYRASTRSNT